ncbi:MAG: glycosyltransferase, partial [Thermoguttaceae bacterium]
AKVFAFPSKLESFGLVAAEAMACGVPVVYSNQHAGPELVDDGQTGLLADPFSSEDVAEKIQRILDNPDLGARLAERAKLAAQTKFSLGRCVDDSLKFYEFVLSEYR